MTTRSTDLARPATTAPLASALHHAVLAAVCARPRARAVAESSGGRLLGLYYAFGETDGFALFEAPDSVTAAAVAMAVVGSGRFKTVKTTEIFTAENAVEAMRKAGGVAAQYRPPAQP